MNTELDFSRIILYILLIALAALFLIPVYGMVITSFRSIDGIMQHGVWSVPRDVSLQAFSKAWSDAGLHRTIPNTFIITIPAVFGSIFVSALGAYALARLRFRGSFFLFVFLIAGLFFPPQVALFPLFKLFSNLTLYDTYLAQILTHIAWGIPVCTMVLRNFFSSIPYSIQEQARIDGCSHVRIFFQIILPLSKPALSALTILQFTWIWNKFLWGLVLSDQRATPVMVSLNNLQGRYQIQWNVQAAGTLLASLPVIIVFFAFQRYFIKGLLMGSTK